MRAREPGGIPYHPYPLPRAWPGTRPTPATGCWRYGSPGASAQAWREQQQLHSLTEPPRPWVEAIELASCFLYRYIAS